MDRVSGVVSLAWIRVSKEKGQSHYEEGRKGLSRLVRGVHVCLFMCVYVCVFAYNVLN